MLKSKIVRETLKAKGYDLNEIETGRAKIGKDLKELLEKLADDKPVVRSNKKDEPEVTILRRREAARGDDSLKKKPEDKEIVQTLVEKIREEILRRTTLRKKKVSFREETEHLGPGQESGECRHQKNTLKNRSFPGSTMNGMKTQRRVAMTKIVFA